MEFQFPLLKGTGDLLVLKSLSWGPMHGFGIASWLQANSGGSLEIDDSAMYQILHRLESKGLVTATWAVTENNRRARYYELTAAGRGHFRKETSQWLRYTASVTAILNLDRASTQTP
jgi:PadR family transcriptional regulator, regulatory protein PadR